MYNDGEENRNGIWGQIKIIKKEKNITQQDLASSIYVSRTLIAKYESGAALPTKENIEKIALYFNVPISELIGKDESTVYALEAHNNDVLTVKILNIILLVVSSILLIVCYLPLVPKNVYDQTSGPNVTPRVVYDSLRNYWVSCNNIFYVFFLIISVGSIAYSLLALFNKQIVLSKLHKILLISFLVAVVVLFLLSFLWPYTFGTI